MPVTITDATTEFVTLAEVKRHANIASAAADDELRMIVGAAQDHVESLIGPVLHRTVTQTVATARGTVLLDTRPVVSITSVMTGGLSASGYVLNPAGFVENLRGWSLTITYMVGRASCPDAVRLATCIIAAHLWRTQLGGSPSALPDENGSDSPPAFGAGIAPPARAADLLAPYMLLPGIA